MYTATATDSVTEGKSQGCLTTWSRDLLDCARLSCSTFRACGNRSKLPTLPWNAPGRMPPLVPKAAATLGPSSATLSADGTASYQQCNQTVRLSTLLIVSARSGAASDSSGLAWPPNLQMPSLHEDDAAF